MAPDSQTPERKTGRGALAGNPGKTTFLENPQHFEQYARVHQDCKLFADHINCTVNSCINLFAASKKSICNSHSSPIHRIRS